MIGSPPREHPETILSWQRALVALAAGLVASTAAALVGPLELVPIVGWVVATLVVLTWVWRIIWPQDATATERLAQREPRSASTDTACLVAGVFSLGAVVLAVVESGRGSDAGAVAAVVLSFVGAVLSWCLVNTVFALKYSRQYYLEEDGGIDFNQADAPAYSDFAYVAFTVGMAFSPPETELTSTQIRRTALLHGLLSSLFGTGVLAVAVNLVTNLGQ